MIENSNLKLEQAEILNSGDGLNWYAYANNNPLRFVDPSGLMGETAALAAAEDPDTPDMADSDSSYGHTEPSPVERYAEGDYDPDKEFSGADTPDPQGDTAADVEENKPTGEGLASGAAVPTNDEYQAILNAKALATIGKAVLNTGKLPVGPNNGGILQPRTKSGQWASYSSNTVGGIIERQSRTPVGRVALGFVQGYAESASGVEGATPLGRAGEAGYAAGRVVGAIVNNINF